MGTVLESVPLLICAGFVYCHCTGRWGCSIIHTVKIAVHSAKGCCTATTMALTSIKQKFSVMIIASSNIEIDINVNDFINWNASITLKTLKSNTLVGVSNKNKLVQQPVRKDYNFFARQGITGFDVLCLIKIIL